MPNPSSSVWATRVDVVTREYINARIQEELKPMRDDIDALSSAILSARESLQRDMGNVSGRVSNTEELLNMSAARVAKLADLAREKEE